MPRYTFFPPDLALSLSRRSVARLAERIPLLAGKVAGTPPLAEALFGVQLLDAEADLLDEVAHFASTMGQASILEARSALGIDAPSWDRLPPADLAVLLVCREAAGAKGAARALTLARLRLGRHFAPHASYEVMTNETADLSTGDLAMVAKAVHGERAIATLAAAHPSVVRIAVLHEGPARADLGWDGGRWKAARARTVSADILGVAADRRRLTLTLARPETHAFYLDVLGSMYPGKLLQNRPAFTLRPLHEMGSAWSRTARLPHPVTAVEVVAGEIDNGKRVSVRGANALDELLAQTAADGGYMYRATLRFHLGSHRSVDATIELPSKLIVSHPAWRDLVPGWLALLGLTDAGAMPDDLSSLAPFTQPIWRWESTFGVLAVRRAKELGILVPTTSRRAADEEHRHWGSMYVAHDIPGETSKYAVADDWGARAHIVLPPALLRLTLDKARLRDVLREQLVLDAWAPDDPPPCTLAIGTTRIGEATVAFFLLTGLVRESERRGLAERLRQISGGRHVALLVSHTRPQGGVLLEVAISPQAQLGTEEPEGVVVRVARQLGVASALPAWRLATAERPLVLVEATGEAWFRRVKLLLADKPRTLLSVLSESPDDWQAAEAVGRRLSPGSDSPDQVARRARMDLTKGLVRSFEEAGVNLPEGLSDSLVEGGRGYRLGVRFVKV